MTPRLYLPAAAANGEYALTAAQARHIIKVLRLRAGDALTVFDGAGNAYGAKITRAAKDGAKNDAKDAATITTAARLSPAPGRTPARAVHIKQCVCAANKMDWAIEKMTELGAAAITPVLTEKRDAVSDNQRERWQRLIIAACEQCGRDTLPALLPAVNISDLIALGDATNNGSNNNDNARIILTPRAARPLREVVAGYPAGAALTLLVGKESGFARESEEALIAAGFAPAHLGGAILRAETAALAALASLLLP